MTGSLAYLFLVTASGACELLPLDQWAQICLLSDCSYHLHW